MNMLFWFHDSFFIKSVYELKEVKDKLKKLAADILGSD